MTVKQVHVSRFTIPLASPVCDSTHGVITDFTLVTVRIRTRDHLEGVGYTYTVGKAGGRAIASLIEDDLGPLVIGRDPRRVEALWRAMWQGAHYVGRGGPVSFAISAMDIALWDLKAKALQEPLWRLLGGFEPRVPAYASGIDLHLTLDELVAQTRRSLDRGFQAIKMKVGLPRLRDDLVRVEAVRALIGPNIPLMVDANMAWTVEQAIRASRELGELDAFWLEEPTAPCDVKGHVRIQSEGALPVAAGENLHSLDEFEAMISAGAVAFPEPDVTNCGGITAWMKIARLAEARNLPVTSHGAHDLHVSLLAAVPNASYLEIHGFGLEGYAQSPISFKSGFAEPSENPGHGVIFQWKELRRYLES